MTDGAEWITIDRDWNWTDEPCSYGHGCTDPQRTHFHYNHAPGVPTIKVYYGDTLEEALERHNRERREYMLGLAKETTAGSSTTPTPIYGGFTR